ncbi:hypothetical protein FDECE_646 [Fusarium decemcellulare]|nr:hypothetical protein FDECE_646 [Fusarium decemcellulare]
MVCFTSTNSRPYLLCWLTKMRCIPQMTALLGPGQPNLMWTPEISRTIAEWRQTGVFPFPAMGTDLVPKAKKCPFEDLRLIFHLASLHTQLASINANDSTLWTRYIPILIRLAGTAPYAMSALLAFSAMHIAFLTKCSLVEEMAEEHRTTAVTGLRNAIESFSQATSDGILAASLLLSWQATDWSSWMQLMQGTCSVIRAMESWKAESELEEFIDVSGILSTAPTTPTDQLQYRSQDKAPITLAHLVQHIQHVLSYPLLEPKCTTQLENLTGVLHGFGAANSPIEGDQLQGVHALRAWLFWMPVSHLQECRGSPASLLVTAYFYAAAVLTERLAVDDSNNYLGGLLVRTVGEIDRRVRSTTGETNNVITAMKFPVDIVSDYLSARQDQGSTYFMEGGFNSV